jgi:radical SAM superfamily enzyme YgiQ (UPF0313 family)
MTVKIAFADMMHHGHSCNAMPYGVALVAAYAEKYSGEHFDYKIIRVPEKLTSYVEAENPEIVCFSNYIWNTGLSCAMAERVKCRNPSAIIVFGGPSYPLDRESQEAYLRQNPYIDFYIFKDGEVAFNELFRALKEKNFDVEAIKGEKTRLPNCHFIAEGTFIDGPLLPVIENLEDIPSPYLEGMLDDFFEEGFIPLTQTTRGCPFQCTFCQDGDTYASRVKRYAPERIAAEMRYIAERVKVPQLLLADLNFGMYKQDLATCQIIADLRREFDWPQVIDINGKNQKERILEAARIIDGPDLSGGATMLVAAVQSTDEEVLRQVKRENVSTDAMVGVAKEGRRAGSNSFSEVILCLPGDSKKAHFKTISDLIDCDVNVVRSHQFIMLPGSEAATRQNREKYKMQTRFRVTPRTMTPYEAFGETFYAPEIDEICVGNSTMSFESYLECRLFNLTIEIFYNYGIFYELYSFLRRNEISIPELILTLHQRVTSEDSPLADIYRGFSRETNEIWDCREELEKFLEQPGVPEKLMSGELGNNEQLLYRAQAIFRHMSFHYAFDRLLSCQFEADPLTFSLSKKVQMEFAHSDEQKKLINGYIQVYGLDDYGLGNILAGQTNVNRFYRGVHAI